MISKRIDGVLIMIDNQVIMILVKNMRLVSVFSKLTELCLQRRRTIMFDKYLMRLHELCVTVSRPNYNN